MLGAALGFMLSKEFIYLTLMASWVLNLPWKREKPFDLIELYAGLARVSRLAEACGFHASAHDLTYDAAPEGQSQHTGKARRSAFDINGEAGFLLLSWVVKK